LKIKMNCNDFYQINMYVKFKYLTAVQSFTKMWWVGLRNHFNVLAASCERCLCLVDLYSCYFLRNYQLWLFRECFVAKGKRRWTVLWISNFLISLEFYKIYVNVLFEFKMLVLRRNRVVRLASSARFQSNIIWLWP
jgi:hypothetical protein